MNRRIHDTEIPTHIKAQDPTFYLPSTTRPTLWDYQHKANNPPTPDRIGPALILIGCSATKLDHPAPACKLYTSSTFTMALNAAETLAATNTRIGIISARHGLIDLYHHLEPYDTRLGDDNAITPAAFADTVETFIDTHLDGIPYITGDIIALTTKAYTQLAATYWTNLITPLAGSKGIGEIRGRLAAIRNTRTIEGLAA